MSDWFKNDQLFTSELAKGNQWAKFVAAHLNSAGIACHSSELIIRDSIADVPKFAANDKDIVFDELPGNLEVKSRGLEFNSDPNSFPYSEAFVDTVSGWKAKKQKPFAIVLVSQKTSAMLVVPTSTEAHWNIVEKYDNTRKIQDTWLTVDRRLLVTMDELIAWLKVKANDVQ